MATILNKVKLWYLEKRLTSHEIKLDFNKNYLPIKKKEIDEKYNNKCVMMNLKMKNDLLSYDISLGIKSEFLAQEFETENKHIEHKYHWKKRALVQTLKRKNISAGEELGKLENEKNDLLEEIKSKFYPKSLDETEKEGLEVKYQEIKNSYLEKKNLSTNNYSAKLEKFVSKTDKVIKNYETKIVAIKKQLQTLEVKVDNGILEDGELLRLDHLSMNFGGLKAVDDLSFSVKEGEIFGLIGPNGAGKTTVFNCITRFYKPTFGEMHFKNKLNDITDLNGIVVHNIIKEGIARTFQNVEMIWELNILENLLVAGHTEYRSGFFGHLFNSRLLRQEEVVMKMKAQKILEDLDLFQYAYQYPMGLPYGTLKKIELARTLMVNPNLIILDEPAAGLNDAETEALVKTIRKIRDDYKTTIFLVEHDMTLVMEICDTVCAISFGKKLAIGTPKEIQSSKVVREAYLGGE